MIAWGYHLLGEPEDAQRVFERFRELAADQHVDSSVWAWAYMGVGDYDEALNQLNAAAENLEYLRIAWVAFYIRQNTWSDPMLEQPEFVEVRERLRPR